MVEKHYALHFQDMSYKIYDPLSYELMTLKMNDKGFQVDTKKPKVHAYASNKDNLVLWHKRLGHFDHSTLRNMHSNELVLNLLAIIESANMCQYKK